MIFLKNIFSSNENYKLLIISLIPFFLVTGPFLSDLALVIISLIYIFNCFKKKIFIHKNFLLLFLFFFLILLISTFFSNHFIFSLKKTLSYLRFLIFSLAILLFILENKNFLKYFSLIFIITYSLVLFDGYFQLVFGHNMLGNITSVENRLSGFFGDELILGSYLSRFLPFLVFCLFFVKAKDLVIILYISFASLLIFFSGERTAFVYVLLVNFFLIALIKSLRLYGSIFLVILLFLIPLIYFNNLNINNRINQTIGELGISNIYKPGYEIDDNNKKIFKNFNFFSPMHENYLYTSLMMFKDKPFWGHGPNTYRLECSNKKYSMDDLSCSTHPHNTYLQLLAETGIFGFLYLFGLFIYFLFISIRHFVYSINMSANKKYFLSNLKICLIASFLITLWPLTPSGNFFNNWLSIIYFFPVGFYLSLNYLNQNNNE